MKDFAETSSSLVSDDVINFQKHSVSESHTIAWTQPGPSKQAPFPRSHHACCLTEANEIVLHGGWTGVKLVIQSEFGFCLEAKIVML